MKEEKKSVADIRKHRDTGHPGAPNFFQSTLMDLDEPNMFSSLLRPSTDQKQSDVKLSRAWSQRRDEIEELKKIFFEFLKRWIEDQRHSIPYTPKFYDRTANDPKYLLPKGILKNEKIQEEVNTSKQKKKNRVNQEKINRTLDNEAELDELIDDNWNPNTTHSSI